MSRDVSSLDSKEDTKVKSKKSFSILPGYVSELPIPEKTMLLNDITASSLWMGYMLSLANGVATVKFPNHVSFLGSTAGNFMTGAKLCYMFATGGTSALRWDTTNPDLRLNEASKRYSQLSNVMSAASVFSVLFFCAGHFAKRNSLYGIISRGPAFNIPAFLGGGAACLYTKNEDKEAKHVKDQIKYEIGRQLGVMEEMSDRAVRANVPGITNREKNAKEFSYFLGMAAAACGFGNIATLMKPVKPDLYNWMAKTFGEASIPKIAKAGGILNAFLYTLAALLYPVVVSRDDKNLRTSEEKNAEWQITNKKGKQELAIATVGSAVLAYAATKGRTSFVANTFLGKTDCIYGALFGLVALSANSFSPHDLLKDPMQSRRWWAGPRLAWEKDTLDYIKNTDPKLGEEAIGLYLRTLIEKVNLAKRIIPDDELKNMGTAEIRNYLENGMYTKYNGGNKEVIRIRSDDGNGRPFWPGAHYGSRVVKQVTQELSTLKEDVIRRQVNNGARGRT